METDRKTRTNSTEVWVGADQLPGSLTVPEGATGVIIFAHGSGSSRFSPRNQSVARHLQAAGLATLLFDLLLEHESDDRRNVFDIDLLSTRLSEAAEWVIDQELTRSLPVGIFGASTGSAAALMTAAAHRDCVAAVVSRGGRPDLAVGLGQVLAPTLLIVGGEDRTVLELNRQALRQLVCPARLEIVPGATHLFSEPGTLEQVSRLASDWFQTYLHPNQR